MLKNRVLIYFYHCILRVNMTKYCKQAKKDSWTSEYTYEVGARSYKYTGRSNAPFLFVCRHLSLPSLSFCIPYPLPYLILLLLCPPPSPLSFSFLLVPYLLPYLLFLFLSLTLSLTLLFSFSLPYPFPYPSLFTSVP